MIVYMRPEGCVQYTWEDIEYLIQFCGADLEEFIMVEVKDESSN